MTNANEEAPPPDPSWWERLAKNEAAITYLDRDMRQLSADMKRIEDKVDDHHKQLHNQIEDLSKGVRRNMWLFAGGWGALTALGAIVLWAVRVGDRLTTIFGG